MLPFQRAIRLFPDGVTHDSRYLRPFPLYVERAFIESVLHVGRTLGLETVAEGIEDLATSETLRSIGCDKGQGFLFSRPVEAERVLEVAATTFTTATLQVAQPPA